MLADTHERALPDHSGQSNEDYLVYLKHMALYAFVASRVAGKRVLDLGCGEGYGTESLSQVAQFVVAADYSLDAVTHARKKYARANTAFVVCDAQHLPFADSCFQAITTFEVIEHIPDVRGYLEQIKRVCVKPGTIFVSTPNKLLRLLPFQKPWNRFHLREYDARGLMQAMSRVFQRVTMLGVTAIPQVLEIEKRRVKQNPLIAYPRMLAHIVLPSRIYDRLRAIRPGTKEPVSQKTSSQDVGQYSINDFMVSEKNLSECINLVAIVEL